MTDSVTQPARRLSREVRANMSDAARGHGWTTAERIAYWRRTLHRDLTPDEQKRVRRGWVPVPHTDPAAFAPSFRPCVLKPPSKPYSWVTVPYTWHTGDYLGITTHDQREACEWVALARRKGYKVRREVRGRFLRWAVPMPADLRTEPTKPPSEAMILAATAVVETMDFHLASARDIAKAAVEAALEVQADEQRNR